MGHLATHLQRQFQAQCPTGWECRTEVHVLDDSYERLLGYKPRADVLLQRVDGSRRLWIEFEVSRADPVANHAKFATAHLFQPQPATDVFVAMVSAHVARGRRNLAANTILLMRHIGMSAFQTLLLPQSGPDDIKKLNHLSFEQLAAEAVDSRAELERAILVSDPVAMSDQYRIHFVGDLIEVICNVQRWNQELATDQGQHLWGKRRVMYFVYDPGSGLFAPSKFCAFLDASHRVLGDIAARFVMTMGLYVSLDESEPRFDGHRAQTHLVKNLGMNILTVEEAPEVNSVFQAWVKTHSNAIAVDRRGPKFLVVPEWFS